MLDYSTTPRVNNATSQLSKVLTSTTTFWFLLGSMPVLTLSANGLPRVDISAWVLGSQMMVSIVNLGYVGSDARVSITLHEAAKSLSTTLWGWCYYIDFTSDGRWRRRLIGNEDVEFRGGLRVSEELIDPDVAEWRCKKVWIVLFPARGSQCQEPNSWILQLSQAITRHQYPPTSNTRSPKTFGPSSYLNGT